MHFFSSGVFSLYIWRKVNCFLTHMLWFNVPYWSTSLSLSTFSSGGKARWETWSVCFSTSHAELLFTTVVGPGSEIPIPQVFTLIQIQILSHCLNFSRFSNGIRRSYNWCFHLSQCTVKPEWSYCLLSLRCGRSQPLPLAIFRSSSSLCIILVLFTSEMSDMFWLS